MLQRNNSHLIISLPYPIITPPPTRAQAIIRVVKTNGPTLDKPSYQFATGSKSPIGTVVGQVQAISRSSESTALDHKICNYEIYPKSAHFSIDQKGVIRVSQRLDQLPILMHSFNVLVEDCQRPIPEATRVIVFVEILSASCQPGWPNLPGDIEYTGDLVSTDHLFKPGQLKLQTCSPACSTAPQLVSASVELTSALRNSHLVTARTKDCLVDPTSLARQRQLCGIHLDTRHDLLPNPSVDLASQLRRPALGQHPQLDDSTLAWQFSKELRTVWEIDESQFVSNDLINPTGGEAVDDDFTVSFWLLRGHGKEGQLTGTELRQDREEAIVCSQDANNEDWRFFSISLVDCSLIVRLAVRTEDQTARQVIVREFSPLPSSVCGSHDTPRQWHHYAITFSNWTSTASATNQPISLLFDGRDAGKPIDWSTSPVHIVESTDQESQMVPRLSLGACYDTSTKLVHQHLIGNLTGLTLLSGRVEDSHRIRCLAFCGEGLHVPNVLSIIEEGSFVKLESNQISVNSTSLLQVEQILSDLAYARPQPGVSINYTPVAVQARMLTLSASYQCQNDWIQLPKASIQLNIQPLTGNKKSHAIELGEIDDQHSVWVDETKESSSEPRGHNLVNSPPTLLIHGPDRIIVEAPVVDPGIHLFDELAFSLPEEMLSKSPNSLRIAAASVPLDACQIWIESPTQLDDDEVADRFDWSNQLANQLGLSVSVSGQGVAIKGHKTVEAYIDLLETFHYQPPPSEARPGSINPLAWSIKTLIGLTCSLGSGTQMTSKFLTEVIITSSTADVMLNDDGDGMQADQPAFDHDSAGGEEQPVPAAPTMSDEQFKALMQEAARLKAASLTVDDYQEAEASTRVAMSSHSKKTIITVSSIIGILGFAVLAMVCYATQRRRGVDIRPLNANDLFTRRRFARPPVDFGGTHLKMDPALRLTANPVLYSQSNPYSRGTIMNQSLNGSLPCIYSPPVSKHSSMLSTRPQLHQPVRLADFDNNEELDGTDVEIESFATPSTDMSASFVPKPDKHADLRFADESDYQHWSSDPDGDEVEASKDFDIAYAGLNKAAR